MIVVAGESLVDLIGRDDGLLDPRPGGGPFNVARALARLQVPCAFLGAISDDTYGTRLRELLLADGVDGSCLVSTGRPTTLALAALDDAGSARYRFYSQGTAAPSLTTAAALAAYGRVQAQALHVGSLGLALEPIGAAVEGLVSQAPANVLVVVDPNCRPGAAEDDLAWRARIERVFARADVIKASTEDLEYLAPGVSPADTARALVGGRTRCVLVTDGSGNILVITAAGERRIVAAAVKVVDTVGAGDAFCAGLLAWCTAHDVAGDRLGSIDTMERAAQFAALVASRTCERPGADPPHLEELVASAAWLQGPAPDGA